MTKRTQKQRISYAEVDSDHDWPSSDEEGEVGARAGTSKGGKGKGGGRGRGGGDSSYGSAKPPKKKARRSFAGTGSSKKDGQASNASKEPQKPKYNADLLLQLPFDMLAEVSSHLETTDLISLAKVSRDFRKLFLSSTTRSLWATKRRQNGFALPDGMSEISFAMLVHGTSCHECGTAALTFFKLQTRLCRGCRKERLVDDRQVRQKLKHLHPQAVQCVQTDRGYYRLADLEEVSATLYDLGDEDEQTRDQNQRLTLWTTKSRRRSSAPQGEVKPADAVERFVEEKKAEVLKTGEARDMQKIVNRQAEIARQARMDASARRQKEREEQQAKTDAIAQELEASYDWTTEQMDFYKAPWRQYRHRQLVVPEASPANDQAAWRVYQLAIQVILDNEEAERQAQPGRQARLAVIDDFFDTLKDDLREELEGVFPSLDEFQNMLEIKPLWHPSTAHFDSGEAAKQLPAGRTALRSFAQNLRVQAIRNILAAQDSKALSAFSSSPSAYPADKYDSAFFNRLTHSFYVTRYPMSDFVSYPACVPRISQYGGAQYRLGRAIDFKQVCAVKSILQAAKLDEATTTVGDADALGGTFRWPKCPTKTLRSRQYDWLAMIKLIFRKGPGIRRLQAGERVQLEYTPPTSQDIKGKGKARAVDYDLFSDEDDVKMEFEEDDGSSGISGDEAEEEQEGMEEDEEEYE
ncbi:hypothetical protein JCM6882_001397 [Rhodosporidiobolus microsporus]